MSNAETHTAGPLLTLSDLEYVALQSGTHYDPHTVLGIHRTDHGSIVRARRPFAASVTAVFDDGTRAELTHVTRGIWEATLDTTPPSRYRLSTVYEHDRARETWETEDPYSFTPTVGDFDLYLFANGRHEHLWDVLGCRLIEHEGVSGAAFAVWAPTARSVRVVGEFNSWDGSGSMMRRLGTSGVWELFLPRVLEDQAYKFEILTSDGRWVLKADPIARYTEVPPKTASKTGRSTHEWGDAAWLERRGDAVRIDRPISIYEVHLGSWRPGLGYRELAEPLVDSVHRLGFTHVEFMPLTEHPFGGSWGYQVTSYYAPTARYGSPDDLKFLIDTLHDAGIGVIMDWVPAHFPKDDWGLAKFDGHPLYEYADPKRGEHPDWGTLVFDFGRNEVRNFLLCSALYWLKEFHIDGLRVDAVASMLYLDYSRKAGEWTPNIFGGRENLEAVSLLQDVNATAYRLNPGITMIAEESTSWPGVTQPTSGGGLGFGYKWNMGWMHDTLEYIQTDPMWRADHRDDITRPMLYQYSENYILPISHDEVVHGKGSLYAKMPGDDWKKRASVRAYLSFMWAHPGKKLLFMGQEYGQSSEWSEAYGLDWGQEALPANQGIERLVEDLNRIYQHHAPLWQLDTDSKAFSWLDPDGNRDVVAFLRWDTTGTPLISASNFGSEPVYNHRIGLPSDGEWYELLNSDSEVYGGSNVGNLGEFTAESYGFAGQPCSASVTLPPLGTVWFARG